MWKPVALLTRLISLLEEQNRLLREIHVALTGRHAQTPSRSTLNATRGRGETRVWQHTPRTLQEADALARLKAETQASEPQNSATSNAPTS